LCLCLCLSFFAVSKNESKTATMATVATDIELFNAYRHATLQVEGTLGNEGRQNAKDGSPEVTSLNAVRSKAKNKCNRRGIILTRIAVRYGGYTVVYNPRRTVYTNPWNAWPRVAYEIYESVQLMAGDYTAVASVVLDADDSSDDDSDDEDDEGDDDGDGDDGDDDESKTNVQNRFVCNFCVRYAIMFANWLCLLVVLFFSNRDERAELRPVTTSTPDVAMAALAIAADDARAFRFRCSDCNTDIVEEEMRWHYNGNDVSHPQCYLDAEEQEAPKCNCCGMRYRLMKWQRGDTVSADVHRICDTW
jgi:uncharacterized Zn-finger protein